MIPSRTTLQGIHCATLSKTTRITGTVARLRGIDSLSFRGGLERGIDGRGTDTALMTKMMDFPLVVSKDDVQ